MEAKIYATNECYKSLSNIIHLIQDLNVTNILIQFPIQMYNDNDHKGIETFTDEGKFS